jgi:hypothetical protein
MNFRKVKDIGFLLCFVCLYLIVADFGSTGDVVGGYGFFIAAIVSFVGIIDQE